MAKKKLNYPEVAASIIREVGGKENISSVRHCITRVRFRLKDESIVNDDTVKNLEGVISVVHGGGEYMCVIGNQVEEVYDEVVKQLGDLGVDKGASETDQKEKKNPVMKLLNIIVGSVLPCLNLICAGGIIKGVITILNTTGIMASDTGMNTLLSAAGDAIFFFLPVFLGFNLAKTLKGDPFLGAIIGAILCYPSLNGSDLVIFGHTFNETYTSTFLPVLAVTAVAVPLANALKKVIHKSVANFLVPTITLLITVPLGYMLIGPLVSLVGAGVNNGINALMNTVPVIAGILFGGLYQVMILFGVHGALTSFSFMNLLSGQPDYIMAIACTVSFAQIGVVLGMMLKTKNETLKEVALPAFISGIFGVTEPAIYGVTLPHIKMFILSCLGGALTGLLTMISGTKLYAFTGLGVFTFFGFISPEQPGFIWPILIMAIPFLASFAISYVLYKDEEPAAEHREADASAEKEVPVIKGRFEIEAPVPGKVVALSDVPDATFAEGLLGNGFAVEPSEGKVYAPFDGTAVTVFETLHALGLQADNGVSILVHVGLETVGLNGAPFKAHIKQGDHFRKGQLLLEFDMDQIKAAGLPTITPVIVTNEDEVGDVVVENNKLVIGA